jgi:mono/diheme cytochrome c family protein
MFFSFCKTTVFSLKNDHNESNLVKLLICILFAVSSSLIISRPALAAVPEVFEAEQAFIKHAKVNAAKGYVELKAPSSDRGYIEWVFNAPASGEYQLKFRYLIKKKGLSPLLILTANPSYTVAKTRFRDSFGKWSDQSWIINAVQNEQVVIRLEVAKGQSEPGQIFIDNLTVQTPKYLESVGKAIPKIEPEFGRPGYENTYYGKVDPQGQRTTLKKWLRVNGFDRNQKNVVRAQYINELDLGFGRAMNCLDNGRVSCYVDNYLFPTDYKKLSPKKLSLVEPVFLATVTMERMQFVDPVSHASRLITAFFAYNAKGKRVNAVPLDFEGPKSIPESCYACHKGHTDSNGNPVGGQYLPWDLGLLGNFPKGQSIGAQTDAFRRLNHMVWKDASLVYAPNKLRQPSLNELIGGWYGGEPLPGTSFNKDYIPNTWYSNSASASVDCSAEPIPVSKACTERSLYKDIYAVYCRTCHVTQGEGQDVGTDPNVKSVVWTTALDFLTQADQTVCKNPDEKKLMPNAELTRNKFHSDIVKGTGKTAQEILCNQLKLLAAQNDIGNVQKLTLKATGNVMDNDRLGYGTLAEHRVTLAAGPSPKTIEGDLILNENGSYTFNFSGDFNLFLNENTNLNDTYTYILTDKNGATSTANLNITLKGKEPTVEEVDAIIHSKCTNCHSPDTLGSAIDGQTPDLTGSIGSLGSSDKSDIKDRINRTDGLIMPSVGSSNGPLSQEQINTMTIWINNNP